jgi:hypothetical protein
VLLEDPFHRWEEAKRAARYVLRHKKASHELRMLAGQILDGDIFIAFGGDETVTFSIEPVDEGEEAG